MKISSFFRHEFTPKLYKYIMSYRARIINKSYLIHRFSNLIKLIIFYWTWKIRKLYFMNGILHTTIQVIELLR